LYTRIGHTYRLPRRPLLLNLSLYHAFALVSGVSVRILRASEVSMLLPALLPAVPPSSGGGV
jgi:hypothetical protein